MSRTIGVLIFDDVEELDFTGPWEVFGMATRLGAELNRLIIAPTMSPVRARYGLQIVPDVSLQTCPSLDMLLIPGGLGARVYARTDPNILDLIRRTRQYGWVVSVCTGALVLAAAGVLSGRRVTTNSTAYEWIRTYPDIELVEHVRWVIDEPIATSAGVSAGIDLALEMMRRWYDNDFANLVASNMEWRPM